MVHDMNSLPPPSNECSQLLARSPKETKMTSNSQSVCPQDALTDPAVNPIDQVAELLAKFPPEVLALFQEVEAEIVKGG